MEKKTRKWFAALSVRCRSVLAFEYGRAVGGVERRCAMVLAKCQRVEDDLRERRRRRVNSDVGAEGERIGEGFMEI